jgi:hypothetical protein
VSVRDRWRERRRKRKEGSRRGGCFPLAQIRKRDSEERERAAVWKKRREKKGGGGGGGGGLESSAQSISIAPINDHPWSDRDEIL